MKLKQTRMMAAVLLLLGIGLCASLEAKETSGPPAPVNASDFIKGLDVVGDLQVRYEYNDPDRTGGETDNRLRARFRMGMKWDNPDENWKVAAGLCTGPLSPNSTSFTYSNSEVFDTNEIRLDYAYAEHKLDKFKFLAGQQKNPFASSWLFWDTDVRPAGFSGSMDLKPAFITGGVYQARYLGEKKDIAFMEAIQAGMKNEMMTAALGFYNYNRIDDYIITDTMDEDYTYQILDLFLSGDVEAGDALVTPYGQVFYNLGAEGEEGQSIQGGDLDPEEENLGYVIGVDTKIDRFKMGIAWAQVGADAVMPVLKDSNFGNAFGYTDVQGFKLNIGYALTKHCSITTTAYLTEAWQRDLDQDAQLYQVDLDYKF